MADCRDEKAAEEEVLHLMTQGNQPYGSQRRCCEICGVMIWGLPQPAWTDDRKIYAKPPEKYVPCNEAKKGTPT